MDDVGGIAVVVLTFRADPAVFDGCLRSVAAAGGAALVVVVDNGQTVARERVDAVFGAAGGDPATLVLLSCADNLGYAGGVNAGLSHALRRGARAVAVLNDDTTVEPGWLEALEVQLQVPGVGAVQPKLLLASGPSSGPPVLNSVGVRVRADGAGIDIGYGEVDRGQRDEAADIELFTGGAVLLGADLLRAVGGFDERYFLYYEDLDLARRGAQAGWTFRVEPAAVVHHAMSSTARTVPDLHRYWQERNRLWFLFRHGSWRAIGLGLLRSLARLAKHPGRPQATAIRDGLAGFGWCRQERREARVLVTPLPRPEPVAWAVR